MEKIDLHLHSNLSDGMLSVDELVSKSISGGCEKIAITDHDFIADYSELANKNDIVIINGVELSTDVSGMHILGYGLGNISKVQKLLDDISLENESICYKIIDSLYEDGYDITALDVIDYLKKSGIVFRYLNRNHIISYLIYKGYIKTKNDFYNMMMNESLVFSYPEKRLSSKEVLEIIKSNGGVSVLAHPSTLYLSDYDLEQEVKNLMDMGLDGIEVKNRCITLEQSEKYEMLAKKLNLLVTVGSDFHSPDKENIGVMASRDIYNRMNTRMYVAKRRIRK